MFLSVLITLILNILMSVGLYVDNKGNKEWIENAKNSYENKQNMSLYPKSQIALRKKHYLYSSISTKTIIAAWLITLVLPFCCSWQLFVLVYLINFMYGRILYWLAIIEIKTDNILEKIYKEDLFL